jgi:PAS domain S-box-containing protein
MEFKAFGGRGTKEFLSAILDAAQEGIQMVDDKGIIQYINTSFTKITGVPASERIGQSVYDVSPDGALVEVLKTRKPVAGKRNRAMGSNAEVISNAAPIFVDGEFVGAVTVFQDITEIIKLTNDLKQRTEIIDGLNQKLHNLISTQYTFDNILGHNPMLKDIIQLSKKAAQRSSTILILGESGTGKELFAHAIHNESRRRDRPFIKVNCAAIPDNLLESELFGYEKGAFTGALNNKQGKFEVAHQGTIFLDEIGDMTLTLQAKLLRVLQEGEIERLGSSKPVKVDVRVIAATNKNLDMLVEKGLFREDLFYRLNVIRITLPPLREKKDDIELLADFFVKEFNIKFNKNVKGFTGEAMGYLRGYSWPGNIRELKNFVERLMVVTDRDYINENQVKNYLQSDRKFETKTIITLADAEKTAIHNALDYFGTTLEGKKNAAKTLGISLATLYNKLNLYKGDEKSK